MAVDPVEVLVAVGDWLGNSGAGLAWAATQARALGRPQAACRVAELALQAARHRVQAREQPFGRQIPLLQQILHGRDTGHGAQ